jgi:hypothetical protein
MTSAKLLLTAISLAAVIGCDKPGDNSGGSGVTETSGRYEGVGEQPKATPERNPATLPTQPAAAPDPSVNGESPIPPGGDDTDKMGTTRTPDALIGDAGAAAGATSAPSRGTAPTGKRE